jgi:hypothetical protein
MRTGRVAPRPHSIGQHVVPISIGAQEQHRLLYVLQLRGESPARRQSIRDVHDYIAATRHCLCDAVHLSASARAPAAAMNRHDGGERPRAFGFVEISAQCCRPLRRRIDNVTLQRELAFAESHGIERLGLTRMRDTAHRQERAQR